ncbi:MAG: hypothetical protein KBC62_03685 [Candidatus Pacebacteria bacterium]|nr:hypothetical protein [Candidatus Paceibacterota bacterium]MBP9843081.1 hypothetical protein [Candidatus Paceibacterota bacterium]
MKLTEMSVAALRFEQQEADRKILELKRRNANEDGPLLATLRIRRSQIIVEIGRRPLALEVA